MASIQDVMEAVAGRMPASLNRFTGVPGSVPFPAVLVLAPTIGDYTDSLGGDGRFEVEVILLVSSATVESQRQLWPYLEPSGPESIPAAINADRSLGLPGVHAYVRSSRPLGMEQVSAYQAYGASLAIDVSTS